MGLSFSTVPVWVGEIAPPHFRGVMAGMHGCFVNVGYFTSNWVGWVSQNDDYKDDADFTASDAFGHQRPLLAGDFLTP